jgi:tripartite motif-containing protein 71
VSVARRLALGVILACAVGMAVGLPVAFGSYSFGGSFGEEGSGPGQFKEPVAVAVDEVGSGVEGDVYVVDKGNGRVEWFSASGEFKGQFDGSGTPAGSFSSPEAIAVDNSASESTGDVYVEDTGHGVVDRFSPLGEYLGQITTGAGGAAFGELVGVSVDQAGEVWVMQRSKEVDAYTPGANVFSGSLEEVFGNGFEGQASFAKDAEGDFYVTGNGHTAFKATPSGEFLAELPLEGPAFGAAVDLSNDDAYLSEATAVRELSGEGGLVEAFGSGHLTAARGLAVDAASKNVYVADVAANTVSIFTRVAQPPLASTGGAEALAQAGATVTGSVNPQGER